LNSVCAALDSSTIMTWTCWPSPTPSGVPFSSTRYNVSRGIEDVTAQLAGFAGELVRCRWDL
jgi:hypothetical protein